MITSAYYTDQDFERFMSASERKNKILFYVCLFNSIICQPGIWYILITDERLDGLAWGFGAALSFLAFICLLGLGYCYFSTRNNRKDYEAMKRQQREEMNALLDEVEAARCKKLNEDT